MKTCTKCGTGKPFSEFYRNARVRGLLCAKCNSAIGYLGDDPNLMLAAAAYLLSTEDILGKAG